MVMHAPHAAGSVTLSCLSTNGFSADAVMVERTDGLYA